MARITVQRIVLLDGAVSLPRPARGVLVQVETLAQLQVLAVVDVFVRIDGHGYAHRRVWPPPETRELYMSDVPDTDGTDDTNSLTRTGRRRRGAHHRTARRDRTKTDGTETKRATDGGVGEIDKRLLRSVGCV